MAGTRLSILTEIFEYRIFRIPDYQRGYSWSEDQLEDLWNDIRYTSDKNPHYMGVLSLEEV